MDEDDIKDGIAVLLNQAPQPVQDFILNKLSTLTLDLTVEYALHLDQGAVLERELLLMLLGQVSPAEFSNILKESGIPSADVRSILDELNEQVFKKLLKEEIHKSDSASVQRVQSEVPLMKIETTVPTPTPQQPLYNLVRPQIRTMQTDIENVNKVAPQITTLHPSQTTPAQSFQTASIPMTKQWDPTAMSGGGIPHITPSSPITNTPPVQQRSMEKPSVTERSSDPYREPIQ